MPAKRLYFSVERACRARAASRISAARTGCITRNTAGRRRKFCPTIFFERRPEEFFRFYRDKMLYPQAEPNAAHLALARLEQAGKLKAVVTQNIDGLHQAAGSKNVLELHGSVHRNHCTRCGAFYTLDDVLRSEGVPRCGCGGVIKPDVVLYGEALDETTLNAAVRAIRRADLLLVGGTSLNVYPGGGPAALFYRRRAGGRQQDADPGRRPGRPGNPGLYRPRTGRL